MIHSTLLRNTWKKSCRTNLAPSFCNDETPKKWPPDFGPLGSGPKRVLELFGRCCGSPPSQGWRGDHLWAIRSLLKLRSALKTENQIPECSMLANFAKFREFLNFSASFQDVCSSQNTPKRSRSVLSASVLAILSHINKIWCANRA